MSTKGEHLLSALRRVRDESLDHILPCLGLIRGRGRGRGRARVRIRGDVEEPDLVAEHTRGDN